MKKIIWIVIIVAVVLLVWKVMGGDNGVPVGGETKVMKVGAILPLSGPIASSGEFAKNGIEMAVEDLKKENIEVEVIFEDGQYDSKVSVSAYNKLRDSDKIDALIVFGTPSAMAIAPLVNTDQIPLIALTAALAYSSPDDYTFRGMGTSDSEAQFAVNTLVDKLNKKKIGIIYLNNDYGLGALSSFKKYMGDKAEVVAEEASAPNSFDFRSQLTKIKSQTPEAIFLATLYKEAGTIVKQAKELGIKSVFMCTQPCENPEFLTTAGQAAEDTIIVAPIDKSASNFSARYLEKFKTAPSYLSLKIYDSLRILAAAGQECSSLEFDGKCMKDFVDELEDFPGLSYAINFDAQGDINDQFITKVIKDGKYVPYE